MNVVYSCVRSPAGVFIRLAESIFRLIGVLLVATAVWTIITQGRLLAGVFVLLLSLLALIGSIYSFEPDVMVDINGLHIYLFWHWRCLSWKDIQLKKKHGVNLIVSDSLPLIYMWYGLKYYEGSRCFGINTQSNIEDGLNLIRSQLGKL